MNADAYSLDRKELKAAGLKFLPPTLYHALEALEDDELAGEVLGGLKALFIEEKFKEWKGEFYAVTEEQRERRLNFL